MLNPFKTYDVDDFPDAVITLGEAPRHPSVVAENRRRSSVAATLQDQDVESHSRQERTATDSCNDKEGKKLSRGQSNSSTDSSNEDVFTIESLRVEILQDIAASGHDTAYDRKAKVINKAIQDIGMGWYQWKLFVLCGFGWLADNLWLQGVALTLPSLSNEFGISTNNVRYTTLSLFAGLTIGAAFWGILSDIVGRRPAFNLTLFICSVFGLSVGGASTWLQVCALYAAMGFGVGGNLPVDGALFLEFLPFASGNLLTMLSVWWPFGQLLGSLIGWGFLTNSSYNCAVQVACSQVAAGAACCTRDSNQGWRYLNFTMGAFTFVMFICRFFLFHLFESPKYLLSRGRQREAVAVVRGIAHDNRTRTWLSEEILNEIGGTPDADPALTKLSNMEILRRTASKFSTQRIGPLFSYKKLGLNTGLVWFMWTAIGMGYPLFNAFLPQYLSRADPNKPPQPNSVVYRNYAIESIIGCPGSIIACFTVNIKYIGRKGTMAIATLLTGIFLFLFTISTDSSFQLGFSCMVAFFQNIMYGVLYAYTPGSFIFVMVLKLLTVRFLPKLETFPAPNRGTGTGIASCLNRIAGLCAPIVAIKGASGDPKTPIYVSGALMLSAFLAMCGLPIETRGKQSL